MYSKPSILKVGGFQKLTQHSRPAKKDKAGRRRPRHILL
ncbi:hypothetical protein BJ969_002133 [Saccharopolyspora gloriosae]|uniref:Lasso RiPP family leader peptide-containing protein n=1 Tax=Saccharopolyspora gloriosae TaxID=455344 RepID=A0A840NG35_9PSEU|nr:hypothetical protein [Saccharopolyspora gloriosae]